MHKPTTKLGGRRKRSRKKSIKKNNKNSIVEARENNTISDSKKDIRCNTKPIVGDNVKIIIKPYSLNNYKIGIVKRVLTKKLVHTRGHKVMLVNDIVGRCVSIIQ